jgi:4-carboxymuconolactone decarboxylase
MALVVAFARLGLSGFIRIHAGYAVDAAVSEDELKELVYLTRSEGIVLYNSD